MTKDLAYYLKSQWKCLIATSYVSAPTHLLTSILPRTIIKSYEKKVKETEEKIRKTNLKYCDERKFSNVKINVKTFDRYLPVIDIDRNVVIELFEKHNWIKQCDKDPMKYTLNLEVVSIAKTSDRSVIETFESYWMNSKSL